MHPKVEEEGEATVGPPWQELHHQIERQAVEVGTQQLTGPGVPIAHQCEWRQEVLAELTISGPWTALGPPFERQRVDEDRLPPAELDVVAARVPQGHAGPQGPALDGQRGERGVPELGGTPLIGIGHERDDFRTKNLVGIRRGREVQFHFFVRDQLA